MGRSHRKSDAVLTGPARRGPLAPLLAGDPPRLEGLCSHGERFAFFQAVRLLRQPSKPITFRPALSLAFPAAEISKIDADPSSSVPRISVNFFGLYGAASPLPSFYTEDLFDDARDGYDAVRGFLDLLNDHILALLFNVWAKYRLFIRFMETDGDTAVCRDLVGALMGSLCIPAEGMSLRYAPLLAHRPRSAAGLTTLVRAELDGVPVELIPCVSRRVRIPVDQQCALGVQGHGLGTDLVLGSETVDRSGGFRLKIGPLKRELFRDLLHGGTAHARLSKRLNEYITEPLLFDWELVLAEGEAQPASLGSGDWSRLGTDTVLFTGHRWSALSVLCAPQKEKRDGNH